MFALKKTITALILPPGFFILALILISFPMMVRRRWKLGLINLSMGLILWALSAAPTADLLMRGLESDFSIPENPSGDVMIVLGGGLIRRVPDLEGTAAPTPLMMGRIVAAVRLHQRVRVPIIVTGGRGIGDEDVAEAIIAKRFLIDLGVPESFIIIEDRARDTAQNARLTAVICQQHGFTKPILLTSAYHLKRAQMAFEAAGMPVTPFPAYFLGSREMVYHWRHLLPRASTLCTSADALHE